MKTNLFHTYAVACLLLTATFATASAQYTPLQQTISSGWQFEQVRGNNLYPATVPGVVHTDLMDNGIIEDPYFRLNERGVQWVDKEDWEYRTTVHVSDELLARRNIELYFEGLDTYADVYLNDSLILQADNMFREWHVPVKPLLKAGDNCLRVYFHSPIKVDMPKYDALTYPVEAANDQSENGGLFDKKVSVFARKAGYHYGWDWGPRLVTSGIWRPMHLIGWDGIRINNIYYKQTHISKARAELQVVATVEADREGRATLTVQTPETKRPWTVTTRLQAGVNEITLPVSISNPRLWWTNGLGEAHRYAFTATVTMDEQRDSRTDRIGLRKIEVVRDKDAAGTTFYFLLNGVPVFAKGANYIPQDNFLPRVTPERHRKTLLDAVNANMNMLRIWGGGTYEDNTFYDLCDEYGILIWQDFMFACATYPIDDAMLDNIRREAIDNVIRLRNHACIALWCGNNEMHTAWFNWGWMPKYRELGVLDKLRDEYKAVFHRLLPEVVAQYDPVAFYWPSSPYAGNPDAASESGTTNWNPNGDAHYWGVWHAKDSIANYNHVRARFFSEYGFQSFPEYRSVLKYAPEARDHDIYSDVMMAHQRGGSHANALIEWYLLNEYRQPADFAEQLYVGQLLQGDAIRTAIEAHRRDMPYCMGTLFWQHNDCWPVASWSSRDYYGRWKAQHYFSRKAFADLLVSPILEAGALRVYVVSDRLKPVRGKLTVSVLNLQGETLFTQSKQVTLPANGSHVQFEQPFTTLLAGHANNEVVVHAVFTESGKNGETVTNNYYPARYKDIRFPHADIRLQVTPAEGGYEVTVSSNVVARGVFLCLEDIDNFFSDNYFDVLPGEPHTIRVTTALDEATFKKQLKAVSY
ncbi:MAG: glycoside hydrolase family 2 protein [Prevotellaceae bacterium]|jgi:beta-mannosidase|nr:glycoside hydrolase family 2 protein [Prevotellaceae bacterium]